MNIHQYPWVSLISHFISINNLSIFYLLYIYIPCNIISIRFHHHLIVIDRSVSTEPPGCSPDPVEPARTRPGPLMAPDGPWAPGASALKQLLKAHELLTNVDEMMLTPFFFIHEG